MEVYYYVPKIEADNIVSCGMKLSQWFDKEVVIHGELHKCVVALLNPKDDMKSYKDEDLACMKLEVPVYYCFVADRYLFEVGVNKEVVVKLYQESVVPLDEYKFGLYRLPEVLVTSTVLPGQSSILDKRMDTPILFDNSEELYINNMVEIKKEEHREFNDVLMYCFYNTLCESEQFMKIEDKTKGIALFVNSQNNEIFTVKIPDWNEYS